MAPASSTTFPSDVETLIGGSGDDQLTGSGQPDVPNTLIGGPGADTLTGGPEDDTLEGDDGNDTFVADAALDGADSFEGGDGSDTADYSARTGPRLPCRTTTTRRRHAPTPAARTAPATYDDIASDVESLIGGSAGDTLIGVGLGEPEAPNVLRGNGGADTLDGTDGTSADTADYSNASER